MKSIAEDALTDASTDQLPPVPGADVGSLPDVLLDRLLGQLAVHFHADAGFTGLDLTLQQPTQPLGHRRRDLGQVDVLIRLTGGVQR